MHITDMNCCIQCFRDSYIIKLIKTKGQLGDCDFCLGRTVFTMETHRLRSRFDKLIEAFEPAEGDHPICQTLAECLETFEVFNEEKLDLEKQNELLEAIRFEGMSAKDRFDLHGSSDFWSPMHEGPFETLPEDLWEEFSSHLKHKRRFLLDPASLGPFSPHNEMLPGLLGQTDLLLDEKAVFWRARIGGRIDDNGSPVPYCNHEMGPPPTGSSVSGRANPVGIPYLYVAECESTAVAEVRPFVGARVSVSKLHPVRNLKVADLTRIHFVKNPFKVEALSWVIRGNSILNMLNEMLAKPVDRNQSEIDYLPTQYLAELILDSGYDGIRYKSAMVHESHNLVFFRQADLNILADTRLVEVTRLTAEFRSLR